MIKSNYIILTGAMGAGKTTVLNLLRTAGYKCINEPAREILKEERGINGMGVPEKDANLFNQLMLERMIDKYNEYLESKEVTIFDRGIADIIAYAELLGTDPNAVLTASKEYRYNKFVFMFNGWEKIYATDDERKVDFKTASEFGENLRRIYKSLNYEIIDVPFVTADERVKFIGDSIVKILS